MNAIEVRNVRKMYRRYGRRKQFATLKSALLTGTLLAELRPEDSFFALDDVSFDVERGRTIGIIGRNGSGKSTALKLVAGITKPTSGTVQVNGRISALIELGAGFHPEISGRENVFINGMMLGLSKREIQDRFEEIVEFAELQDFIDAPVKTYSSGMYMRLGFAVAINVNPDVLLVDEVLAVGDEAFTHKCLDKFAEFRRRGKTVLIVTHTLDLVTRFCDEALWLDHGRLRAHGDPRRIVDAYITDVQRSENEQLARDDAGRQARVASGSEGADTGTLPVAVPAEPAAEEPAPPIPEPEPIVVQPDVPVAEAAATAPEAPAETPAPELAEPEDLFKKDEGRWGSREAEITGVTLVGADGQPAHVFQAGSSLDVRVVLRSRSPLDDVVVGVAVFNADGICCYGTNTHADGLDLAVLHGVAEVHFRIDDLPLVDGTYKLDVAVHRHNGVPYDYHRLLYTFRVKSRLKDVGIIRLAHQWAVTGGLTVAASTAGRRGDDEPQEER